MLNRCYLLLGSNMGEKEQHLIDALRLINKDIGTITSVSSVFESESWGYSDTETYYNIAIEVKTKLTEEMLLEQCLLIENKLGRKRSGNQYEARTIDIDIIFFNSDIIKTLSLEIPHPRVHLRRFALEPLNEICSGFMHPFYKKTIIQLLSECTDKGWVNRLKK